MGVKYNLVMPMLLAFGCHLHAQDFDADSVYYTKIAKREFHEPPSKLRPAVKIFSDTSSGKGISYFFNIAVGPLVGCSDCESGKDVSFTSSTLHGVTLGKKWRAGMGLGFDSYDSWETLPLFGSVSWDWVGTKNTNAIFFQFQYGWSFFAWRKRSPWDNGYTGLDGGRMLCPQIGYRIKYHDLRLSLAIGAKSQRVVSYFETPSYYYTGNGVLTEGEPYRVTMDQDMRRFMISVGIGWK